MQALQTGTFINERYIIQNVINVDSIGFTYTAEDSCLKVKCIIKELFVKDFCFRESHSSHVMANLPEQFDRYRNEFKSSASLTSHIKHPNVINITDIFEGNNTFYYVMELKDYVTLSSIVKQKGALSETLATQYILKIADALSFLHLHNISHLAISPENIIVDDRNEPVLLNFDMKISKVLHNDASNTVATYCTPYDPIHLISIKDTRSFAPECDLYALGATFFKLLTGCTPPYAIDLLYDEDHWEIPKEQNFSRMTISVIRKSMMQSRNNRLNDAHAFINELTTYEGEICCPNSVLEENRIEQTAIRAQEESYRKEDANLISLEEEKLRLKRLKETEEERKRELTINQENDSCAYTSQEETKKMSGTASGQTTYSPVKLGFWNWIKETLRREENRQIKVNTSVFAPSETKRGDFMMVQVFLYKNREKRKVARKAAEVDPEAKRLNHKVDSLELKNGDRVKAELTMSGKGMEVDEPIQEMIWQGHYTDCQFGVFIPEDYRSSNTMGTVVLTVNGIPRVRMMFKTKIVSQPQKLYAKIESKAFQKIFISYSHKDEATVKYFAKAFQAQGVDYFFDRHYLKAGDVYPLKIKEYINSADLFILCWSKNAAESDYVQLERQQALALAFPQKDMEQATLSIHPISIEPHADYPSDMKEVYNFEEI